MDQKTVINWFNLQEFLDDLGIFGLHRDYSYFEMFGAIIKGLWQQYQDGLTLGDIENILFYVVFIRFIILAIRYNLKTSFYITCIGLFAGYLWYRHLIDLIGMYRSILVTIPYLHKLGIEASQLQFMSRQTVLNDLGVRGNDNVHWYNPGQLLYYAFTKGIINTDSLTGLKYYIDPISMVITNLKDSEKANILPLYYKIYNKLVPGIFNAISKFWAQLSGTVAYTVITRIGKRYCPYLVRWHWTFLLIIGFIEQILIYFCYRISYFQSNILIQQIESIPNSTDQTILFQINLLNTSLSFIIFLHLGLIFFGLFHAIWGQYFYFPFLVENIELHVGPRPKNSIYSGGNTSWQDNKEKNTQSTIPKLWYGWFGSGTATSWNAFNLLKNIFKQISRIIQR